MAFTLTTPLIHNGQEFPYAGVSLIASPHFKEGSIGAQVVLRLDPYNIVEGVVVRPTVTVDVEGIPTEIVDRSTSITIIYQDAYTQAASDAALATSLGLIAQALQSFIDSKGL
jgi:hypothetical protein